MAISECRKGHLYDVELYSSCPYCNNQQAGVFSGQSVSSDNRTMPLNPPPSSSGNNGFLGQMPVGNDGLTAPPKQFKNAVSVLDNDKTMGYMKEKMGIEPTVGWVTCVKGGNKGKSFVLAGRINTIGRKESNDICLSDDRLISNENHARISYSEKTNHFHLIPADGKNVIYINGEEVFAATKLNPYDMIDFSATTLLFTPLCSDRFLWSDME